MQDKIKKSLNGQESFTLSFVGGLSIGVEKSIYEAIVAEKPYKLHLAPYSSTMLHIEETTGEVHLLYK